MDDRCDGCHAAKATHVWVKGEHSLQLCDHHDRQHAAGLNEAGFRRLALDMPDVRGMVGSADAGTAVL